jgi:hypothetical protein
MKIRAIENLKLGQWTPLIAHRNEKVPLME